MRIGLVMDASCDLPQDYVARHRITVLPIHIDVDGDTFADRRDARETQRFLEHGHEHPGRTAHVEPPSCETIQSMFLDELVTRFDCVFCLTIAAARAATHDNAVRASFGVLKHYRAVRQDAGQQGPFLLRVIDTQSLYAGAAVVVAEAVHVIDEEQSPAQVRERLSTISRHTYGYLLPRDPRHFRAHAQRNGTRATGLLGATLGSAFNVKPILCGARGELKPVGRSRGLEAGAEALFTHTAERIRAGLLVPTVSVSYGGPLFDLRGLPGYEALSDTCDECGVELLASPMSITGMVTLGEGALAVGFACADYTATF